jgi:GTPase SAR1 family protein
MDRLDFMTKELHCSLICGQTGCGKTIFVLDLLQTVYRNHFEHIVIFCPTLKYNKSYRERKFIWSDDEIYVVDPSNKLSECLEYFYRLFEGTNTLFIIDDCSAERDIVKKGNTLAKLTFSGRHAGISIWILTQKYNSVLKDFREQLKVVILFYTKDRNSFEDCLSENDVVETKEERNRIKQQLKTNKFTKLIIKIDIPTRYACF